MRFLHAAGLLAATLVPTSALAVNYTYTNVIDSTSPFGSFGIGRLNDVGQVSFRATRDAGGSGIFRQDGLVTTTIADSSGPVINFGVSTDINDAGQVAYTGGISTYSGVFRGSGGAPTTIADNTGFLGSFTPHVRINESGLVAFRAQNDGTNPPHNVLVGSGGNLTTIALGASGFVLVEPHNPEINDAGMVSFAKTTVIPQSFAGMTLETGNGAVGAALADTAGAFLVFSTDGSPINNAGHVLLGAELDAGGEQLLFHDGSTLLPLVDTNGGGYNDLSSPQLNNSDAIAFFGVTSGFKGIFNGADPLADQVVIDGQSLFGSTIAADGLTLGGINDLGQVVFNYTLTDGRTGIAIATPIPEPGGVLVLAALAPLLQRRRRR